MHRVNEREVEASAFAAVQDAIRSYLELDRVRRGLRAAVVTAGHDIEGGAIQFSESLGSDLVDVLYEQSIDILTHGEGL